MSHCSFNSSDHSEEKMVLLEQLHISSGVDIHDDIIRTRQAISINMNGDEDTVAMSELAFNTHHDSNSKIEDSDVESYSDSSWESEDSIFSAANKTHNDSGIGSDIGDSDSEITPPSSPDIDDGYASDDSCASHDSFVTNIISAKFFPTERCHPPGYSPNIHKNAKDRPSSDTMQVAPKVVFYSRLERLPAELRIQILKSMPDLETLHSFIKASPTMHAQYLYDRHNILSACLGRELDGFYVDAYAHMKSRVSEFGSRRGHKSISDFLNSYQSWLAGPAACPDVKSLPPSRVRWMAAYHTSVAQPLVRRYGSWALENLEKATLPPAAGGATACGGRRIELSRSEEIRIFRALYRHEIYHHLFGYNLGFRCGGLQPYEINEIFFSIFQPWENEAIGCIDIFVRQQYDGIFDKIRDDLHPHNIRFRQPNGFYHPEGSFDLDREHDDYMDGTVQRGLKTLARALAITKHEELVPWMSRCLLTTSHADATLLESISFLAQDDRHDRSPDFPNARDQAEQRHDSMNFLSDSLPLDGPPLAWVLLWHGVYVNHYGDFTPKSLKRWGYVMWDAGRWDNLGAKELIAQQWKPRSSMLRVLRWSCGWRPLSFEAGGDNREDNSTDEYSSSDEDSSSDEGSL
ncbi:hypothetical protein F4782DRAFT_493622 [Xylaria castorea]|nr:hypothetical protein F4782DRAFT_493622 [Xylaria castorea]